MFKRCRFVFALMFCLCVFSCGAVNMLGASAAWATEPGFKGNALVLSGQLGLYFYFNVSKDQGGTMSFDIANGTVSPDLITLSNDSEIKTDGLIESRDISNDVCYGFRCDITSIQMADKITATYTPTNGAAITTSTDVAAYLTKLLSDDAYSQDVALHNVVNAIRDYGHYAQITLKETNEIYGTHTSMDCASADLPKTTDTDLTSADAIKICSGDTNTLVSLDATASVSFALDLDSKTALHVYISADTASLRDKGTKTGIGAISVDRAASNDNAYEINATAVTTSSSNKEFVITFSNISAHQLGDKFTIPVTINGKSYTIKISPMSYVYAVTQLIYNANMQASMGLDNDTELTHFKQAVVALYNYYKKTIAYRTTH